MKNLDFLKTNLIAHRGLYNYNHLENKLESFKDAIENKCIIELDVHLTKENKIIVFHDDDLKRLYKNNIKTIDLKEKDLKKYDIPTLKDVLDLINGQVPVIIELKYDRKTGLLENELVKILDNYKGQFVVKSFNPFIVRWFKINRKDYIRGLLVLYKCKNIKEIFLKKMIFKNLCKPDFISCNYKFYKSKKMKKLRKKIPVICWTIKNKEDYEKCKPCFDNLIMENIEKIK